MNSESLIAERAEGGNHFRIAWKVWGSTRLFAIVLLMVAVLLGAHYRFHRLGGSDLDGDEAVAWTAARSPDVRRVILTTMQVEKGGKLPVYHILLHTWIDIFGDSLSSMRAPSASLGTIAIVLLFVAVREICHSLSDNPARLLGETGGAFAALIYALNITLLQSDRESFPC